MPDLGRQPYPGTRPTDLDTGPRACLEPCSETGLQKTSSHSSSTTPLAEPLDDAELFAVLTHLDSSGVTFDLTPDPPHPPLVWTPPLDPTAEAMVAPWLGWLAWVALGRYSRHAPTRCERCGFVAMARVIQTRATDIKAAGWRVDGKCALCQGRRGVPHPPTFKAPPRGKRPFPLSLGAPH